MLLPFPGREMIQVVDGPNGVGMKLMLLALAIGLILSFACLTAEAETRYGSFVYEGRVKNSLFLTGDIRQGDSFELRKPVDRIQCGPVLVGPTGPAVCAAAGFVDTKIRS